MGRNLCFAALLAALVCATVAATPKGETTPAPAPQLAEAAARSRADRLVLVADDVAKEVEALRGWTFKQPIPKELTSVDEVRRYLDAQMSKAVPSARLPVVQGFLRTIGFLPPTLDLKKSFLGIMESQIGGFYDFETKTMHLVARDGLPPFAERFTLAHELTHALDDQYADLAAFAKARRDGTEDMDLASQAVVEGSATALMMQYMARMIVTGKVTVQAVQNYGRQETENSKVFVEAPRYFSAMLGSYLCGTGFLAKGQLPALLTSPDDHAIGEALLAALKDPPQSTEQILHPEKYWDAARRDLPVVIDDDAAITWLAQPGRYVVHADTVGEMLTAILTSPPGSSANLQAIGADAWTNAAAAGWGGDRFYLLATGENAVAAKAGLANLSGVWVTAWDTPADRDEFMAALPKGSLAPGAVADPIGPSVAVMYFGVPAAERAELSARLREKPLPMTKAGQAWKPGT